MKRTHAVLVTALVLATFAVKAEPDEALLGKGQGYPLGNSTTWGNNPYRVGSWSALDRVPGVHVNKVAPATPMRPLPAMVAPPAVHYRYGEHSYSLNDYLERQRATGLLVLKDGQIVAERYRYGRTPGARFVSFSMAKSVTSLLVGVAQAKGFIASLNDPAEKYAKALAGTPYGATQIRHLLTMTSGLQFSERYDGNDDVTRLARAFTESPRGTMDVLQTITQRNAPPGERFAYASSESEVLGYVLRGATGQSLAALTQAWLWEPMGAEHEAFWQTGGDGQEGAFAFFNASLRDWGRLGVLLADNGRIGEHQVIPRDYLMDATDEYRQPNVLRPGRSMPYYGYGYQFWLLPLKERTFLMRGVFGQHLFVQPASGLVMVVTSAWEYPGGGGDDNARAETDALWRGVLASLGGRID
ncbi:serine hydrolase [Hydrogenophaga sp.]|uniref:serine hydrolase domain-containing protein n=1 Tax=Hydrogenophaga sp. TaxID=1904254 RepID=UPI00271CB8B4|nr:serine hydrolase [Hydrogenophaga sp.]MDO9435583.1 serine hydrolase [Hydrogenophaga sp.]